MVNRVLALLLLCSVVLVATQTPLDSYINNGDNSFAYSLIGTINDPSYTAYKSQEIFAVYVMIGTIDPPCSAVRKKDPKFFVFSDPQIPYSFLNLTSQTWLSYAESNKPVWTHLLTICVPSDVSKNTAFLYIDGGSNTASGFAATSLDTVTAFLCPRTQAVTARLQQVPNQPITFANDPTQTARTEDGIIAYTWEHFLTNTSSDPNWVLQFPQTKSAVRAMDAIQDFVASLQTVEVDSFVMCGASKRGWTTWLAAGVDDRIIGFVPIVMPILSMVPNLNNDFRSLGGWSWTFGDYYGAGNMAYLNTPAFDALAGLIDPINFNARFESKPAYIIVSSQDEFFQPDSANFFFQDLYGEKYLRVLPGADHSFSSTFNMTDVLLSITSFFNMVVDNTPSPTGLQWNLVKTASRNGNAAIVAVSNITPKQVLMYSTNTISTTKRDFRLFACYTASGYGCYQGLTWNTTVVNPTNNAYYVATRKAPAAGWGLFFLEFIYEIGGSEFKVTSEVNIVPDTLPYPSCGTSCGSVSLANP